VGDQLFARPARADACGGEHLLQPGALGVVDVDLRTGGLRWRQVGLAGAGAPRRAALGLLATPWATSALAVSGLGPAAAGGAGASGRASVAGRGHGRASLTR